jgi:uncharacterized protein (TIGR03083 family)
MSSDGSPGGSADTAAQTAAQTWTQTRAAFEQAAEWFAQSVPVGGSGVDSWESPGLGVWSVRDLVGHTSRSLITVESYLTAGAQRVDVESAAGYYDAIHGTLASAADAEAVAQRGRDAGTALGDDPAGQVRRILDRVLTMVHAAGPDALVGSLVGGMRLVDYLPTRTFELVVHTCDLAVALGRQPVPPQASAQAALELAATLAARRGLSAPLLLAVTGRRGLPAGYSVL